MEQFCHTLCTMTLAASVAALAVMILRLALKKAPRWLTCALWLIVFLRMVCPVSFALPVSLMPQTVTDGIVTQRVLPAGTVLPLDDLITEETPEAAEQEAAPVIPAVRRVSGTTVLFGLWAAGAVGMLAWAGVSYGALRRRVADAVLVEGSVYESDKIDAPFVCGFVRPRVYLPVGLAGEDRRYVILHEGAHIARKDHLTKPLAWLALSVHWFNPVLWLAYWLFGRDVEAACDQRVIRTFHRGDTAGYAAALLHLGRKRSLTQAVPLAFGEENTKGRIKHVLDYKHPGLFVVIPAIFICVAVGVLLLANPGARNSQLEGVQMNRCRVLDQGIPVDLPQHLTDQLVPLVRKYDKEDYVALSAYDPAPGDVILSDIREGTLFYLTDSLDSQPVLVRVNHDRDGWRSAQNAATLDGLAEDRSYQRWREDMETYLTVGRADDLYGLKIPYIGDHIADGDILQALNVSEVAGPYTMELQTTQEPYGITIHLEQWPPTAAEEAQLTRYFEEVSELFLALVDNAGSVTFSYSDAMTDRRMSTEAQGRDDLKNLSQEEFRELYARHRMRLGNAYSQAAPQSYTFGTPLYLSQGRTQGKDSYTGTAILAPDLFRVELTDLLSSAWPEKVTVPSPKYISNQEVPQEIQIPNGTVAPFEGYTNRSVAEIFDEDNQTTGYRLYQLDDDLVLSHWNRTDQGWEPDWIFQLNPTR